MEENIAQFRFVNYQVVESEFRFDSKRKSNKKLNVTFERSVVVDDADSRMRLELVNTIEDEDKSLFLRVRMHGFFEFDSQISDDMKGMFVRINAPAILFPYVRAYVSTLTSLSGIEPVILPTLNLSDRNAK